jgi:hypothetical protein
MAYRETGVRLFGSITLNHYVGGINPMAVRAALGPRDEQGGFLRAVWLPTVHAAAHICAHCAAGDRYDIPPEWSGGILSPVARPLETIPKIAIDHATKDPLRAVLDIVAENDLILASGHLGPDEVFAVLDLAQRAGVRKFVVTHARYSQPGLKLAEMRELAARGAFIELCYVLIDMGMVTAAEDAEAIRTLGAEHVILATDLGQIDRIPPGEALQRYGARLLEQGIDRDSIDIAMKRTPWSLLGGATGSEV